MGWWLSDDGESVIGDGPVDFVMDAHRAVEARRAVSGLPVPSAEALFDAAARVMRAETSGLPAPSDDWPSEPCQWTDAELPLIGEALRQAVVEYQERPKGGTPTAAELRETIAFAIGQLTA